MKIDFGCFFRHKWSKWSEERRQTMIMMWPNGAKHDYVVRIQSRKCVRCEIIQEREV